MLCPICGHDKQFVILRPEQFDEYTLRQIVCQACGKQMTTKTTIVSVKVTNPETLQVEEVPIDHVDDRMRDHCLGRRPHPSWENRVDG